MKIQRVAVALTLVNLVLLLSLATQPRPVEAQNADAVAPVLRGRALELVDDRGRIRAEIKILPADPSVKMPDGTTGYPETVLLRLIDSEGGPNVKIGATEDGSAVSLGGEKGYVQLLSRGTSPIVRLVAGNGREQVIRP